MGKQDGRKEVNQPLLTGWLPQTLREAHIRAPAIRTLQSLVFFSKLPRRKTRTIILYSLLSTAYTDFAKQGDLVAPLQQRRDRAP
jgi:hypothetical protein